MDQHPVPQNISSYEFRLVGDMTLKQFFQLAGGALVGFVIYSLPLPLLLKWPLIGFAVLMGIMLAFVPVSGRPFSQWLMAFFRAIYSPTEYVWQATPVVEAASADETTTPPVPAKQSSLDMFEAQIFSRVTQLFSQPHVAPVVAPQAPVTVTVTPPPQATKIILEPVAVPDDQARTTQVSQVNNVRPPVAVPESKPVEVTPSIQTQPIIQPQVPTAPVSYTPQITHSPISTPPRVATSTTMNPSTYPNIIVGQVVDIRGQTVEGAIIEISDAHTGIPARALKTNRMGQFQTATPLAAGEYTVMADKQGLTFTPLSLTMENKIMQPLLITAQN